MCSGAVFWVTIVTLLVFVECQYEPYNCRRPGVPCNIPNGGICDLNTVNAGQCTCTNTNFVGYDCSIATSSIRAVCNVACAAPHTCVGDGVGNHRCVCTAPFVGSSCTQRRVRSTCTSTYIEAFITPLADPFVGTVYVSKRASGLTACDLTDLGDGLFYQNLSLSSDSGVNPCSAQLSETRLGNGNVEYVYLIRVQYDTILTKYDEEHTIRCIHDPNGNVATGIIVNPAPDGSLTGDIVSQVMAVTTMDIIATTRVPPVSVANLATTVTVGEDLELRVIVDSPQIYANHYVESCTSYNLAPGTPGRESKTLILDGCPPRSSLNVVRPPLSKTANTVKIPIEAFKFDSSSTVFFECSVEVCTTTTDLRCLPTPADCTYGGAGSRVGRKKRQSSDGESVKVKVEGQFLVVELSPDRTPLTNTRNVVTQESCLQSIPFVAVTVVFATLLLVTLIVAIFLCVRNSSRNKRPAQKQTPDNGFYNVSMSKA